MTLNIVTFSNQLRRERHINHLTLISFEAVRDYSSVIRNKAFHLDVSGLYLKIYFTERNYILLHDNVHLHPMLVMSMKQIRSCSGHLQPNNIIHQYFANGNHYISVSFLLKRSVRCNSIFNKQCVSETNEVTHPLLSFQRN